jgi:hypothetical protein
MSCSGEQEPASVLFVSQNISKIITCSQTTAFSTAAVNSSPLGATIKAYQLGRSSLHLAPSGCRFERKIIMATKAKTKLSKKEPYRGGCMQCPGSHDTLEMDTVLYQGFRGYYVRKDGDVHYWADSKLKWEEFKKASDIEAEAVLAPDHKWEIVLDNPFRGATGSAKAKTTGYSPTPRWASHEQKAPPERGLDE